MPLAPPVINAACPAKSMTLFLSVRLPVMLNSRKLAKKRKFKFE